MLRELKTKGWEFLRIARIHTFSDCIFCVNFWISAKTWNLIGLWGGRTFWLETIHFDLMFSFRLNQNDSTEMGSISHSLIFFRFVSSFSSFCFSSPFTYLHLKTMRMREMNMNVDMVVHENAQTNVWCCPTRWMWRRKKQWMTLCIVQFELYLGLEYVCVCPFGVWVRCQNAIHNYKFRNFPINGNAHVFVFRVVCLALYLMGFIATRTRIACESVAFSLFFFFLLSSFSSFSVNIVVARSERTMCLRTLFRLEQ